MKTRTRIVTVFSFILVLALAVPAAAGWTNSTNLPLERAGHASVLLQSGKVLVSGGCWGWKDRFTPDCVIYDPAAATWTATGSMSVPRSEHGLVVLQNGKVLAIGGFYKDGDQEFYLATCEIYDPAAETWSATGPMATSRTVFTTTLLPGGKVLVAGGLNKNPSGADEYLGGAEIFDPASGTWTAAASLAQSRSAHTATLLPSGHVLVVGGASGFTAITLAEEYDHAANTWTSAGNTAQPHAGHTATRLGNNKVLIAAGASGLSIGNTAEIYDPATGTWSTTGALVKARALHTATLLQNGKVLAAGGGSGFTGDVLKNPMADAELYDPGTGTWAATDPMPYTRSTFTADLLNDGRVLVAGGLWYDGTNYFARRKTDIYTPEAGGCTLACTASASPASGNVPLPVNFTASATPSGCAGTVDWQWVFGDGEISSQQNPSHTYTSAGSYNWSMTASVEGVTCTKSGTITASVIPVCSLTCTASAAPTSGQAPLPVNFTSTATPTTCTGSVSYAWAFGDGTTSTLQSPSHTYSTAGSYDWTLTATIQGVTCSKTGTITVSAVPVCSLTCTASAAPTSGQAPLEVVFTSTATPANCTGSVAYAWAFGDGTTSTQQNPSHSYSAAGSYTWTMTATVDGVNCIQSGTVTVSSVCALTCTAEISPTTGQAPLSVTYSASSTPSNCQGTVTYAWAFGDGGTSAQTGGEHVYDTAGSYTWTMTATVDGLPCSKSGTVTATETPSCSLVCTATVPASASQGTPVSFTSTTTPTNCTGNPTYAWTFGDGGTSPLQNPHHTYSAAGLFNWTLTVTVDGVTCAKAGSIAIAGNCSLACTGSATPSSGMAPLAVSFTGTATPSQCSDTPTFFWDFGDGQNASAPSASHTYTQPGTYAWTLLVTADGVQCIQEGTVTATANPNPSVLTVGGSSAAPGATVTVPVTLAGKGASICSLTTDISFDPALLTFLSAVIGPAASDVGKELSSSTPSAGVLRLGWMGFNATPMGDGDVAYVSFTVAAGAAGSTTLNHACGASDCAGGGLAMSCPGGLISFTSGIPGDCDSNGEVSIGEVQKAINMFLGTLAPGCGVDCSGDGTVSIGEVQKVINGFLGLSSSC